MYEVVIDLQDCVRCNNAELLKLHTEGILLDELKPFLTGDVYWGKKKQIYNRVVELQQK